MTHNADYVGHPDVCITWDAGGFLHQCHYKPGHKTRHHCHCGESLALSPNDSLETDS
jgi:hypothetical protein